MNEQAKGHCKHGEFILAEGCPCCIEEERLKRENPAKLLMTPLSPNRPQGDVKENIAKMENSKPPFDSPALHENEPAAAPKYIVKIQFLNDTGEPTGRQYSYFTVEPLGLGEIVQVPVSKGNQFPEEHLVKAAVVAVNVPESEIAAFRDKVKTIPSKRPDTSNAQAILFTPEPAARNPDEIEAGESREDVIMAAAETVKSRPAALTVIETHVQKPTTELFQLYQEAASLLQFAKTRVIVKNEDLKPATNDLAIIATCKKAMFARKTEFVGPLKAKLDLVNQAFADLMFPVEEADRLTRAQVIAFDNEQRRKSAEAKRIEDEKFKLAQAEAANNGTGEVTVPLGTAVAPTPVPERTRTDMGTLGGRDNWKAHVVNFKLLDDRFKLPNEQMLNALARSSKGTAEEPGVEFYNDRSVTMRTKN